MRLCLMIIYHGLNFLWLISIDYNTCGLWQDLYLFQVNLDEFADVTHSTVAYCWFWNMMLILFVWIYGNIVQDIATVTMIIRTHWMQHKYCYQQQF